MNVDQLKIANDHNIRILIEQNADIRHCETLSFTTIVIFFTVLGLLITNTQVPLMKDIQDTGSIINRIVFINNSFWSKIHLPLFWMFVLLTIVGGVLRLNTIMAERRIEEFYDKFCYWNQIERKSLVLMQENALKTGMFITVRRGIPSFLFIAGAIGMLLIILINLVLSIIIR